VSETVDGAGKAVDDAVDGVLGGNDDDDDDGDGDGKGGKNKKGKD
jgi:hypothetical protein